MFWQNPIGPLIREWKLGVLLGWYEKLCLHSPRHGRDPPYYRRSLMAVRDGKLITNFSRRLLVGHPITGPRTPGIPSLTEAQAEALDTLHEVGRKHEIQQRMMKGDIRFINNLALMHRRNTFLNSDENHRHLLRLWLHNPQLCPSLPADLRLAWDRIFNDHEREEEWHYLKLSSHKGQYIEPLWEGRRLDSGRFNTQVPGSVSGPEPEPKPTSPRPPPVAHCD